MVQWVCYMEDKVSRTNEINKAILKQMEVSTKIKIGGAGLTGQDNIAVGLQKEIELIVEGEAGDFFGALNSQAILNLNGNVNRFLGDCMSGGGIIVSGNAGFGVGSYLSGGIIVRSSQPSTDSQAASNPVSRAWRHVLS